MILLRLLGGVTILHEDVTNPCRLSQIRLHKENRHCGTRGRQPGDRDGVGPRKLLPRSVPGLRMFAGMEAAASGRWPRGRLGVRETALVRRQIGEGNGSSCPATPTLRGSSWC